MLENEAKTWDQLTENERQQVLINTRNAQQSNVAQLAAALMEKRQREKAEQLSANVNVRLRKEVADELDVQAERFGVTRSDLLRLLIDAAVTDLKRTEVLDDGEILMLPEEVA